KMKTFVLQHSLHVLPYFGHFPKIALKFLKGRRHHKSTSCPSVRSALTRCMRTQTQTELTTIWTSGAEAPRVLAFLNMREMALVLPFPMIELVLKVRRRTEER